MRKQTANRPYIQILSPVFHDLRLTASAVIHSITPQTTVTLLHHSPTTLLLLTLLWPNSRAVGVPELGHIMHNMLAGCSPLVPPTEDLVPDGPTISCSK